MSLIYKERPHIKNVTTINKNCIYFLFIQKALFNCFVSVSYHLSLCILDVTPASFETPVGRSGSPSITHANKGLDGGKYSIPRTYCKVFHLACITLGSNLTPSLLVFIFLESKDEEIKEEKELPCLDRFLAKNTSEDNASFEHIMDLAKDKEKMKHAWLYEAEAEFKEVCKKKKALLKHKANE